MKGITRELLTLELDGLPPTVNHMYMNAKGRRFRTSECREYQQRVTAALQSAWRSPPFTGRIAWHVKFTTANRRRWDLDNRLKALQDCLQMAGIIKDDSQIDFVSVEREYTGKEATILNLEALDDKGDEK